jgi:hypothetical protein
MDNKTTFTFLGKPYASAPELVVAGEEALAALYLAREVLGSIGNIQHAIDLLSEALKNAKQDDILEVEDDLNLDPPIIE